MDYAKEYNLLLAENIKLQRKLRETSAKAIKYIDLAQHERAMRLKADTLNTKLNNTIKVMKMMLVQKDEKVDKLLESAYKSVQKETGINPEDISIDIRI